MYEQIGDGVYHEYDALGRPTVTGTISELGTLFSGYSYGSNFRTVYSDAKHNDTYYSYQAFDDPTDTAITNISYPEGVSVAISRDNFGNTLSITRAGGGKSARRSYVYDANMRLCKTIEPETAATIIDYDAANNVAWRAPGLNYLSTTSCDRTSVASSGKITYKYDPLNRPSMTTYPDGSPGVAPTYYANGLLQTMGSGISHWSYGYNRRGLLETEQLSYGGKTYTLKRSYDQHGNLSRLTYPDGAAVDLAPNALGEPARVGNYANAIRYYPTGAVASFTYGNGITHAMTPNVRGLPQRTIDAGVINDAYTYDANGNVQSITDAQLNSANRTMAYDNLDRLRSVSAPNLWGTATYTYDALDNLTSSTVSAGAKARTMTHTYDAATNRLASLTGTAAYSATFGYDPRGNITRRGAQVFAFDYANRMRSATGKGTYDYDGFGRRVSVVGADNVNRIQVYSRDAQLMFAGVSSLPVTSGVKYIYLGNHILAEVSAGGVQYNHTDGLGSPVARTDGNRAIVGGHTRYEPYGLIAAGPAGTLGFTGHVNATDVGLVYMQQRYYDPVAGRMLSTDPVSPDAETGDSVNRYAYAENNPYRYVDQDGRQVLPVPMPSPPVVPVTGQRPRSDPFASPVQSSSQQGDPVGRKLVEIYNKLTSPSSAPPPDDEDGPNSKYSRTTKGKSVENRSTNVSKDEFKQNLRESGWKETVSRDGQTTIFEKDGARYVIRENARSTGGPTADFYKANSSSIDVKIRLGGN